MNSRQLSRMILALVAFALPAACGGSQAGPPGATNGTRGASACESPRSAPAECAAPVEAKTVEMTGSLKKSEETALARINEEIKGLGAEQSKLCSDYTACAIDDDAFHQGAASIKTRIDNLPALAEAVKNAKTYGDKKRALDGLYRGVVPPEKRVGELTFRMGMTAQLPESAGGAMIDVQPGTTLPTGTRAAFSFEVSSDAYLYIFQKSPTGEVNVLFPNPDIGTKNPLRAGVSVQIPSGGQRFKLNNKDLGTENVYLVASRDPITSLDASLEKVKQGKVTTITGDSMLRSFTEVAPGNVASGCKTRNFELEPSAGDAPSDGPQCARSRGLVLENGDDEGAKGGDAAAAASAGAKTSFKGRAVMEVRTDPGDSLIVKVFPFNHVTEGDYTSSAKSAPGAASAGMKTRGLVIED